MITIDLPCFDTPLQIAEPVRCKPCRVSRGFGSHRYASRNGGTCRHCKRMRVLILELPHTLSPEPEEYKPRDRTKDTERARIKRMQLLETLASLQPELI